jgi:hypothetical protein
MEIGFREEYSGVKERSNWRMGKMESCGVSCHNGNTFISFLGRYLTRYPLSVQGYKDTVVFLTSSRKMFENITISLCMILQKNLIVYKLV